MREVAAVAPAKINLALRVGARRADGFHPLATLFHAVDLREQVTVRAGGRDWAEDRLTVTGRDAALVPLDPSNLVFRAANRLRRSAGDPGAEARAGETGSDPDEATWRPVEIDIVKGIPVAGGLAGGSADGAAALVALNELWQLGLSQDQLVRLGGELGSDVPFALVGGNAIGVGRGERLSTAEAAGQLHWVLLTNRAGLATPAVFERFDALAPDRAPEPPAIPEALLEGLRLGDPQMVGAHLVNDLEPAAFALRPELAALVEAARAAGACGAILSGSGPTVACLAQDAAAADALAARLAKTHVGGDTLRATGPAPGARPL
jgi:4-diphosphocytidyl-2-C-methyl-D-erythritol kinase